MGCEVNYMWSLSSLVCAFLDLAIAYFLLCASSVVFMGTKFLGFFGLPLPCPCSGLFWTAPNRNLCLKRLLVDFPNEKVSNVHLSVKGNFPFNDHNCHLNLRLIGENDHGLVKIEGEEEEGSCSSVSDARKPISATRIEFKPKSEIGGVAEGRPDVKGKRAMMYKNRGMIRHRRKRSLPVDRWTSSSVASYDPSLGRRESFELNGFPDEDEQTEKNVSPYEEVKPHARTLEEEQAAYDALYLELEKERNASATAADEAMAMISRLQEEKALIEMEARQYQRIYEEKSAYDAEEMDILKEILLRREREKHFLQKEVEAYRKMICPGNDEHILDTERQLLDYSLYGSEDPVLMLHKLSASIEHKAMRFDESISTSNQNLGLPLGMESSKLLKQGGLASHPCSNQDFQEKEMVTMINDSHAERERLDTMPVSCQPVFSKHNLDDECLELHGIDPNMEFHSSKLPFDKEVHVHDVHVIDDGSNFCNEGKIRQERELYLSSEASASQVIDDIIRDSPSASSLNVQMEEAAKRSSSDITNQLPPLGPKTQSPACGVRRHSMSTFDIERLKIDYEVEKLRERLKMVQEGREKLNLSVENGEGETLQLKLLEDIAQQLREIRHLTQAGKEIRQASLPLPSSKAKTLKKKRCRSVSVGVQNSS